MMKHIRFHGSDKGFEPSRPGRPTDAQPGTREKFQILCDRIERGEQLFHPRDRDCFPD